MIRSIKMSNFAVYEQGAELSNCRKINLIYGNNGSGKTIISNFLMNPDAAEYEGFSIQWDSPQPLPIYVFNKQFRIDNFGGTNIPGIYTLGNKNVEIEKAADEIESKIQLQKNQLIQKQQEYQGLNKQIEAIQNACIESIWERSKVYKQLLGDSFKRGTSKLQCFNKVRDSHYTGHQTGNLLELKRKADVLNSQKEVQYVIYPRFDDSELAAVETNAVWNESASVSEFSGKDKKIVDWVHQGLQYLDESNTCPFCEQPILSGDFHARLDHLKSDNYHQKVNLCNQLLKRYETAVQRFLFNADRVLKANRDEGAAFLDTDRFTDILTNLRNLFHANMLFMQQKRDSFSKEIEIQSSADLIAKLNQCVEESNSRASQANLLLNNLKRSKTELQNEAWASFCNESADDIRNYENAVYEPGKRLSDLGEQIGITAAMIRELELQKDHVLRNSVNIRASVDKINNELSAMGINTFCLQLSEDENHYVVVRQDGEISADDLSEGESTLVMLLYFLQLAEGASEKNMLDAERIIVIDDPVSNLDDTALNAVLDRIGQLISKTLNGSNIQQVFVLSHRRECTKKLRACDKRLEDTRNIGLWILRKKEGFTTVQEFNM